MTIKSAVSNKHLGDDAFANIFLTLPPRFSFALELQLLGILKGSWALPGSHRHVHTAHKQSPAQLQGGGSSDVDVNGARLANCC